jgi:1,4-alpha-glucan branching enzyme
VQFVYVTGIQGQLFDKVRLTGSWGADGRYSDNWSSVPMKLEPCWEDGCPAYTAAFQLDAGQAGTWFHWGVILDAPGARDVWGIMTEEQDAQSRRRHRSFQLQPPGGNQPEVVQYYLNESRRMGAQHFYARGQARPGIRFMAWAPNAKKVEVVMASIWDEADKQRKPASLPDKTPATQSLPRERICGGYIDNEHNGRHPRWGPFKMTDQGGGLWATDPADPVLRSFDTFDHSPYMFRVTRDDGSVAYRTDLFSRCQIGFGSDKPNGGYTGKTADLDGTVSSSVVVDPDKVTKQFLDPVWPEKEWVSQEEFWNDPAYMPRRPVPNRVEDLVLYELHVGALGFGKPKDKPGTLEDALKFLDYLEDLGVNAVELLPMSEFGGGGAGWGYATSHYFAIEYGGGGRDNYKFFIRECHRRGIAVILDVVYNHYNHNADRAEWMYDTTSHAKNAYYWYEGKQSDYGAFDAAVSADRLGTGGYVDNMSTAWAPRYYEERVRKMFVSSAVALALEFKIDGFRMDQTTSIHAYNVLHADGRKVGSANLFGQKLLRELTRTLKLIKPDIMLMAEDHSNWDMVTEPPDGGGLGFDAPWFADFYHHLIGDTDKGSDYAKLLKTAGLGDDRALAMNYFAGALAASGGKKVVYHKSHDEAGNGQGTHRNIVVAVNGAPLVGVTRKYAEARCRFAAGVNLLSAGTPMFLFGDEVGAEKDFLYGKVLENREDLLSLRKGTGKNHFEFYRQILRLRLAHPGLRSRNIDVVYWNNENRLLVFHRWGGDEDFLVVAGLNNQPFNRPSYVFTGIDRIPGGRWREVFNSNAAAFGGDNVGNYGAEITTAANYLECVVPANAVLVFQRTG